MADGRELQLTEARAVLEVLVARHAARHINHTDRAELNRRLHDRLREISRHTVASDLIGNPRDRAAHLQFRLALQLGRPAQSLLEHEAIVEAVVSGDENASAAAMEQHVASVLHVLRHWDDLRVSV